MTGAEHVEIKLSDLSRIELQPTDVLVYRHPERISLASADSIKEQMMKAFPGHRVCILDDGAELAVLRPVEAPPSKPAEDGPSRID